MCLDSRYTRKQIERRLESKQQKFIVYKAANKIGSKYYPTNFDRKNPYKKNNKIKGRRSAIRIRYEETWNEAYYRPYFHLFFNSEHAVWWHKVIHHDFNVEQQVILMCEVNKKDVHVIGKKDNMVVVVVTKFKILEEM